MDNRIKGLDINRSIIEASKVNIRLMQVAALALWADGKIHENERKLFDELCRKFDVELDIDNKRAIPTLESVCNTILSKTEKIQMLDIACRMVAVDGEFSNEEKTFIANLFSILGVNNNDSLDVDNYIDMLIRENDLWKNIVSSFNSSEYELLSEFKVELSDGASWYKLGQCYKDGTNNIRINKIRSQECFKHALELGYKKAESEIFTNE